MQLYETHLPVANTEVAAAFYTNIVGLRFAHRDLTRDIVFLWAGEGRKSMVGLWGPTTVHGRDFRKCHLAFEVCLPELLDAGAELQKQGVVTKNFFNQETTEPSVIGWMPSAQLYFNDPDGHSVEFIALLDDQPQPDFIGPLSDWKAKVSS